MCPVPRAEGPASAEAGHKSKCQVVTRRDALHTAASVSPPRLCIRREHRSRGRKNSCASRASRAAPRGPPSAVLRALRTPPCPTLRYTEGIVHALSAPLNPFVVLQPNALVCMRNQASSFDQVACLTHALPRACYRRRAPQRREHCRAWPWPLQRRLRGHRLPP